ncbi:RNA-binding protein [Arachidicoccus ginsenosidimutans]|uniref:RNA recognition motif domain-containing protein n=1 Tax=Arachidicoccus sp. BS20 TaxID=1850526 RepID=UPI0007F04C2C|nr:RNA-binding protein [Arachidicoccus sp. BS20]ANI89401.1 RNA-binding protein [Arachidicoccus sp. BS20]
MNIYVSNLSFDILDEDLRGFFEEFGKVDSSKVVFDRETRRSRGFGFVEMPDDDEARKAIKSLDGGSVDGRPLKVNEAKPREERTKSYAPSGRSRW